LIKTNLLRNVPLFRGLAEGELAALADAASNQRFPRDARVISEADEGETFFVLSKGKVKVTLSGPDGREVILTMLGPGSFFGDMSLLDGRPRSANVTTMAASELLTLRRTDFLDLIRRKPQIAVEVIRTLASRLRKANHQIAGLSFLGIVDRVCDALLGLFDEHGEETAEGLVIHDRPTHQILADMTGATRETVSRALRRLEEGGYIAIRGRTVLFLRARRRAPLPMSKAG
jgi:CRP/FNR family transcriptional regulator, cyclic AMP receptor protein